MRDDDSPVDAKTAEIPLHPLLLDDAAQAREFRKRRSPYIVKKFHHADEAEAAEAGWEIFKRQKRSVQGRKKKPDSAYLEDRFWCLCSSMGYPVLNGARFKISFNRADHTTGTKQIDVFAKDAETVLVVECKSKEMRGRRSLQKDLHETELLQKPIADAIRNQFGS